MPDGDGALVLQLQPIESVLQSQLRARTQGQMNEVLSEDNDVVPPIPTRFSHAIFYDFVMIDEQPEAI